jgi:hypothetical protein
LGLPHFEKIELIGRAEGKNPPDSEIARQRWVALMTLVVKAASPIFESVHFLMYTVPHAYILVEVKEGLLYNGR